MDVKIIRADGVIEYFETTHFIITKAEDMDPILIKVEVRNPGGKLIAKWKRPHAKSYAKNYVPQQATEKAPESPAEKDGDPGREQPEIKSE